MVYPRNFENKIGFDRIREILKEKCIGESGRKFVDKIHFTDNFETINKLVSQTEEFRQVLLFEGAFPEQDYFDLTQELLKLNVAGTHIEAEALFNLKTSLNTISSCINFIKNLKNDKYPYLKEIISEKGVSIKQSRDAVLRKILKRAEEIIDDKGKIKDSASPELQKLRKELISRMMSIEKKINHYLNIFRKEGLIPENESATIRNGRSVIPVYAANKRKVRGIIQDESSSGQTIFIEPEEIIEINNEIRELEYEEKREIIRILLHFSDFIRADIDVLINCYRMLGMFDFIRAKAKFAIETEGIKPNIRKETKINWTMAKHPLLLISHKKRERSTDHGTQSKEENQNLKIRNPKSEIRNSEIIPNDFYLDTKQRILIISGPNAGGKSVCLKTVGLLQYMLQCGMLVTMAEQSDAGIFSKIFIDIGDEQSIENDLSTYSSHLLSIKYFIANCDSRTLILIDEFGAGTEPQLGGSIAEASLEEINKEKTFGIITTHYSNLKLLADRTEGLINGSMQFDTKRLQPTYRLKTGIIGSSYAYEIAKKIGFPTEVLKNAELKTGSKQVDFEKKLLELESKKHEAEAKEKEFRAADDILADYIAKYKKLSEDLEKSKKAIINDAKQKAEEIIKDSNRLIEKTIKEIKEAQAEKEKTKKARQELTHFTETIKAQESEEQQVKRDKENKKSTAHSSQTTAKQKTRNKKQAAQNPKRGTKKTQSTSNEQRTINIIPGDYVRAKGKTALGQVIDIFDNEVIVAFSSFNMKLSLDEIEKVEQQKQSLKSQVSGLKSNLNINEKMKEFKTTIDVRGKRAEEVLPLIEKYIDDAILLRIKDLSIIHGKGNGILRQIIRDYLKKVKEVKEFKDEVLERGGDGVTVVKLKL